MLAQNYRRDVSPLAETFKNADVFGKCFLKRLCEKGPTGLYEKFLLNDLQLVGRHPKINVLLRVTIISTDTNVVLKI